MGTEVLDSKLEGAGKRFFYAVTRNSEKGVVFVKLVNASPDAQQIDLNLSGVGTIKNSAKLITLKAKTKEATNSITTPANIVPVETTINGVSKSLRHVVPSYSIQVIELGTR